MARECPNPNAQGGAGRGRGTGGGGRACYKSNQEGHMARDCPEAGGNEDRGQGGAYKRMKRDDDAGGYTGGENAWGNQPDGSGWGANNNDSNAGGW